MTARIVKRVSIPILLIASIFSPYAASYEPLVDFLICLATTIFVRWAFLLGEYLWAAGFVAMAVVFSPFVLVVKVFLLMGLSFIVMIATLLAAFQPEPLPAD